MFNPKKYLVYVNLALDLPMERSKWCTYCVKPIGNTLRPEDRKKGLLADMVIPIFPNMQCSSATRPPIRPTPDFPFQNCFHWIDSITNIRVRRPACGFTDDSRAIRLESPQHHATRRTFKQDYVRMDEVLDDEGEEGPVVTRPPAMVPAWALRDPIVRKACCAFDPSQFLRGAAREPVRASTPALDRDSSLSPLSDTSSFSVCELGDENPADCENEKSGELTAAADIFSLNIFGWDPDPTFPLIPLVDLWCELDEHLTAEDIPSPMEWFEEKKRFVSITTDAFARKERALRDLAQANDQNETEPSEAASAPLTTDLQSSSRVDELAVDPPALMKRVGSSFHPPGELMDRKLNQETLRRSATFKAMSSTIGSRIRRAFGHATRALCCRSLRSYELD